MSSKNLFDLDIIQQSHNQLYFSKIYGTLPIFDERTSRSPDKATSVIRSDRARAFRKLAPTLGTRIFKPTILYSHQKRYQANFAYCLKTKLGIERTKIITVMLKWNNFGKYQLNKCNYYNMFIYIIIY